MRSYVISTDSSADLSEAYLKEHQITMISLSCILNGKIYNSENPITPKQLYDNFTLRILILQLFRCDPGTLTASA